jgi:hypothetical protein
MKNLLVGVLLGTAWTGAFMLLHRPPAPGPSWSLGAVRAAGGPGTQSEPVASASGDDACRAEVLRKHVAQLEAELRESCGPRAGTRESSVTPVPARTAAEALRVWMLSSRGDGTTARAAGPTQQTAP